MNILELFGLRRFKKGERLTPPRPWPDPPTMDEAEALLRKAFACLKNLQQTEQMSVAMKVFGMSAGVEILGLVEGRKTEITVHVQGSPVVTDKRILSAITKVMRRQGRQ